jgi:hypothetical protein
MPEVRQKWVRVTHGVRVHTFRPVLSDLHPQDGWESQLTWQAWVSQHVILLYFRAKILIFSQRCSWRALLQPL